MLTQVDDRNGIVVFKGTNPKGKVLAYRAFPKDGIGDSSKAQEFTTLGEARALLGEIPDTSEKTPPKSVNPQNTAGYKASPKGGKTKH